jgi:hypothetical protein
MKTNNTTKSKLPTRLIPFEEFELPDGCVWLAMVPGGWARGDDLASTVRKACRNGTKSRSYSKPYSPSRGFLCIYVAPSTVVVDDYGRIIDDPSTDSGNGSTQAVAHWDQDGVCRLMLPERFLRTS